MALAQMATGQLEKKHNDRFAFTKERKQNPGGATPSLGRIYGSSGGSFEPLN